MVGHTLALYAACYEGEKEELKTFGHNQPNLGFPVAWEKAYIPNKRPGAPIDE
jgi:hypothetical protein